MSLQCQRIHNSCNNKFVREKNKVRALLSVNPLNPNIKIQILICYPYKFSIEVVGRIC